MASVDGAQKPEVGLALHPKDNLGTNSSIAPEEPGVIPPVAVPPAEIRPVDVDRDVIDLRSGTADPTATVRRIRLGWCLVDLATENVVRRVLDGHLGRPPGTGTVLVASANLDHITHFARTPEGDGLDPGRMDDWLVLLDGMPLVQAASQFTGVSYPRLAGADLLPEIFTLAEARHCTVAVLGGRDEIREPLARAMDERWPDLCVAAHLTPSRAQLTDEASSLRIQAEIAGLVPDLLVVCLGKPLQERWMARYARGTGAKVVVGFGAAVDFVAGTVPRAPKWMQDNGLEWSYRLMREPRRMARRYLVQGPAALRKLRSDAAVPPDPGGPMRVAIPSRLPSLPPPVHEQAGPEKHGGTLTWQRDQCCVQGRDASPTGHVRCTAVVVTYQSAGHVGALLEALRAERESGLDLDVVVVDHASTDGTPDVVARSGGVRLVPSGGNFGYAAGVNAGDRLTPPGHALLVLNPDLVPAPGSLGRLLGALGDPQVGVVVPRFEDDDGALSPSLRNEPSIGRAVVDALLGRHAARLPRGWSGMVWDPHAYDTEQSPDWATGAALLVSADCRAAVGPWDERFFLYSEETDYLRRVRDAGLRITYLPDAVVRHVGGGSGASDGLHALCVVNSVRYYRRYHARPAGLAFAAVTALCELLRARRPESRLALRALLSPKVRSGLPGPGTSTSAADPGRPRD
jgi:exopolysaccharide biosynthesis WecB/TagA/CpsF family protein